MATLKKLLSDYEKLVVTRTLQANAGDKEKAARALGITARALNRILERHGLVRPRFVRALPIPRGRTDDEREG